VTHTATMRALALTAFLLGAPASSIAQQAPSSVLTLNGAVELALQNHPAIREASAGSMAAAGEIAVARTAYLPRLDAVWQVNQATRNNVFGLLLPQSTIPSVSGPVLPTESLAGVWSTAGGLLLSWEAVDFGRRGAAVDVARAVSTAADAQRRVSELEVASAAADAFLGVAAADAGVTGARANVQRLSVFADSVRGLVQNQLRAGAELSRAQAELAGARNRLAEAERNAAMARASLANAVGDPGAPIHVNLTPLLRTPVQNPDPGFSPSSHPRVMAAEAEIAATRARDRVLAASDAPRVELQGALSGRGVSREIDGSRHVSALRLDVPNWAIGLSITFPTLEIFRTQARRQVEGSRLEEASARRERTVQALQTQELQARAVIEAARRIAENAPQQLQAARDTDTQARARYDAGLTTVLEVAEAQRLLAQAEAESAVAGLAVWRALLAEAILKGDIQQFLTQLRLPSSPDNQ
jgi:outer membrane protein